MCDPFLITKFENVFQKLKNDIKYFHTSNYWKDGQNMLFVTDPDKVYALSENEDNSLGLGHKREVNEPEEVIELRDKEIQQFFIRIEMFTGLS